MEKEKEMIDELLVEEELIEDAIYCIEGNRRTQLVFKTLKRIVCNLLIIICNNPIFIFNIQIIQLI